jgi:hypothetical protein
MTHAPIFSIDEIKYEKWPRNNINHRSSMYHRHREKMKEDCVGCSQRRLRKWSISHRHQWNMRGLNTDMGHDEPMITYYWCICSGSVKSQRFKSWKNFVSTHRRSPISDACLASASFEGCISGTLVYTYHRSLILFRHRQGRTYC